MSYFETLALVLFEGRAPVADFRAVNGTDPSISREDAAKALLESMERLGLLRRLKRSAT
jgi:hypothetical protein